MKHFALGMTFAALIFTLAPAALADLSRTEQKEARSYYRMMHGTDSFEEHLKGVLERGYDLQDHYRTLYDDMVLVEREQRQLFGK